MKDIHATIRVDISPIEEEIFNNLQKDARWGIKKAKKEGLIVEESTNEGDWEKFYKIYKLTMEEAGIKIETLKHLKEHSKVFFICKKEGKIIAGATLDIVEQNPYLSRNASLKEYQKFQPNNLLYWHCILWGKKKGYGKLDLGGWQINAKGNEIGVNKFKERWGKIEFQQKNYPFLKAIKRKMYRKLKGVSK